MRLFRPDLQLFFLLTWLVFLSETKAQADADVVTTVRSFNNCLSGKSFEIEIRGESGNFEKKTGRAICELENPSGFFRSQLQETWSSNGKAFTAKFWTFSTKQILFIKNEIWVDGTKKSSSLNIREIKPDAFGFAPQISAFFGYDTINQMPWYRLFSQSAATTSVEPNSLQGNDTVVKLEGAKIGQYKFRISTGLTGKTEPLGKYISSVESIHAPSAEEEKGLPETSRYRQRRIAIEVTSWQEVRKNWYPQTVRQSWSTTFVDGRIENSSRVGVFSEIRDFNYSVPSKITFNGFVIENGSKVNNLDDPEIPYEFRDGEVRKLIDGDFLIADSNAAVRPSKNPSFRSLIFLGLLLAGGAAAGYWLVSKKKA